MYRETEVRLHNALTRQWLEWEAVVKPEVQLEFVCYAPPCTASAQCAIKVLWQHYRILTSNCAFGRLGSRDVENLVEIYFVFPFKTACQKLCF